VSRILFATHGGASADGAARFASLLTTRWQASLDVLAVLELFPAVGTPPLDMGLGLGSVPSPEAFQGLEEALRAGVAAQLQRCHVGETSPPVVRTGSVAQQIADVARAGGADLIVIGLGAHGVIDRAMGGETALQLVQLASAPVLAVPADTRSLPRRIVAAIDFTATSVRATRVAARCLAAGDVLDLVHVLPETSRSQVGGRTGSSAIPLRELASQLAVPSGVEVVAVELHGDAARSLLEYLERSDGEMIALGSHGYGWWKRLALGSVASKVLRLAARAVLVAPASSISVPG